MHVIAASGMNVTFVAGALIYVIGSILKRQFAIVIAGFGIVFYMFLAGFEPSIVRAGIMAILAFGAGLIGKQYWGLFSLLSALYAMLLHSPRLLFDVGFQLSFLATLGILIIKPMLGGLWRFTKLGWLGEDIGTTVAAQIAVFPVLMSVFGKTGILSILVNGLVLWTVPFLMTFGALALITESIPLIGQMFLYLCLPFLLFFEWVVNFFGSLGWVWEVEEFSWQLSAGYYLILIAIILLFKKKSKIRNNF